MSTAPKKRNKANEQIEELTADLQRLQAEFANYKRREQAARMELQDHAKRELVLDLLPVLDNIDRALSHLPEELQGNAWAGGVQAVAKQADELLGRWGVTRMATVGQPFDHNHHDAIAFEDGDGEHEVVAEELQPGYLQGDRVLRPAMVKVKKQ